MLKPHHNEKFNNTAFSINELIYRLEHQQGIWLQFPDGPVFADFCPAPIPKAR